MINPDHLFSCKRYACTLLKEICVTRQVMNLEGCYNCPQGIKIFVSLKGPHHVHHLRPKWGTWSAPELPIEDPPQELKDAV